tara:strand:- start:258 stop:446 length:189 start_codon:yes stop_codon:yes gene_type:complete
MPKLALGILLIVAGIFYFIYSRKQVREKMDKSGYFKQSILVKDVIGSLGLIIVGLILIIKSI